jgi:SAM-dependent methyltransferase
MTAPWNPAMKRYVKLLLPPVVVELYRGIRQRLEGTAHSNGAAAAGVGVHQLQWGSFRRLKPIDPNFGWARGQPIDRYYIDHFLHGSQADIHGRVLEIADRQYTRKFGGDRVTESDVLHAAAGNHAATLVGDLTTGRGIPEEAFDCIILTQTLLVVFDVRATLATVYRSLKPGGVVLATFPGISQISRHDMDRWGDYWRFTTLSGRRLFEEVFPAPNIRIGVYGNVLSAMAFLHGLAAEELKPEELAFHDKDFEVLITVRANKPAGAP